jgi:putative transposase
MVKTGRADLQPSPKNHGVAYRPPRSISSFVAGFKSAATKRINEFRKMPESPVWQSRFYDHIIRNNDEYIRIEKYIMKNPQNWDGKLMSRCVLVLFMTK